MSVEAYPKMETGTDVTHGLCPDCREREFGEGGEDEMFVNEMVGEERTDWLFFASATAPPEPGTLLPRTVD